MQKILKYILISLFITFIGGGGFIIFNNYFLLNNYKLNIQFINLENSQYPELKIVFNKLDNNFTWKNENISIYDENILIDDYKIEDLGNSLEIKYKLNNLGREAMERNVKIINLTNSDDYITFKYLKEEQEVAEINITQIDSNSYPNINMYFSVEDSEENLIEDLNKNNITISLIKDGVYEDIKIDSLEFIEKTQPISINMVMDTSDSMKKLMLITKNIANDFLNKIDFSSGDRVELIEFNNSSKIRTYFTNNKQSLVNSVNGMEAAGMTAFYDALIKGLNETNKETGAKCIIAFTDGIDNESSNTSDNVINLATKLEIPIYIIGLGDLSNHKELNDIAINTNGKFINIENINELNDVYSEILNRTRKQYVLKYQDKEDGNINRNIKLSIKSRKFYSDYNEVFNIKPLEYRVNIEKYNNLKVDLNNQAKNIFNNIQGDYSLAFKDLSQSDGLSINNEKTVAASVIKIYIMIEAYNQNQLGNFDMNSKIVLEESMKVNGSGILRNEEAGSKYSMYDLIRLMMQKSDNTAANILIDKLGMNNINNTIRNLGCINTELNRKMMDQDAISNGIENYTSVDDLMLTLTKLYNGECVSQDKDKEMLEIMKGNEMKSKIPSNLPNNIIVASKSGEYNDVQNDAGIIYTNNGAYILCVTTKNGNTNEQITSISDISKKIYDEYIKYKEN